MVIAKVAKVVLVRRRRYNTWSLASSKVSFSNVLSETTSSNKYLPRDFDDAGGSQSTLRTFEFLPCISNYALFCRAHRKRADYGPAVYNFYPHGQRIDNENIFAEEGRRDRPGAEARPPPAKVVTPGS